MAENILENKRIDQLDPGIPVNGDFFVFRSMVDSKTKRVPVDQFLTSKTSTNFTWQSDNDPGYAVDEIVEWAGKLWKSLVNDNLNNIPGVDPTKWEEVSKAASGLTPWQAGAFTEDDVFVTSSHNGITQILQLVSATRPFNSTDIAAEEVAGSWKAITDTPTLENVDPAVSVALNMRNCRLKYFRAIATIDGARVWAFTNLLNALMFDFKFTLTGAGPFDQTLPANVRMGNAGGGIWDSSSKVWTPFDPGEYRAVGVYDKTGDIWQIDIYTYS